VSYPGDARRLPVLLGEVAGAVDLVVVSPPYACDAGLIDKPAWRSGRRLCDAGGPKWPVPRRA
jgi:hypothetical protein